MVWGRGLIEISQRDLSPHLAVLENTEAIDYLKTAPITPLDKIYCLCYSAFVLSTKSYGQGNSLPSGSSKRGGSSPKIKRALQSRKNQTNDKIEGTRKFSSKLATHNQTEARHADKKETLPIGLSWDG